MKGGKGLRISLIVLAVVFAIIFSVFVLPLITESPPAVLVVESGSVEVSQSPFRQVTGQTQISAGDAVRTNAGGKASIVFFGSSILRLEENTTLTLSELDVKKKERKVSLKQDSGRIWNKVIKLSGIEDFSLETPDAVATIRGTAFDSLIKENSTTVAVVEGTLNVTEKVGGQSADINSNQQVSLAANILTLSEPLIEDDWIRGNKVEDERFLLELRKRIKSKYWIYLLIAKSQYKLTDQQVDEYIDNALRGVYSQDQISGALSQLGFEIKV